MNAATRAWGIGVLAAGLCACATSKPERLGERDLPAAVVRIEGKSGRTLTGQAEFRHEGDGVMLSLQVSGASPGVHAVHLHQNGDCSSPDAKSAGDHWNPTEAAHGHLMNPPSHLGDIGNLIVKDDGTGELEFHSDQWTLGTGMPDDVMGKALVIHEKEDDLVSQPAGNAGARIGCGVVKSHPTRDQVSLR